MDKLDSIVEELRGELGDAVEAVDRPCGDVVLTVARNRVHDALSGLKTRGFDLLLDIAGVDGLHLGRRERFEIVYFLYSLQDDLRLRDESAQSVVFSQDLEPGRHLLDLRAEADGVAVDAILVVRTLPL